MLQFDIERHEKVTKKMREVTDASKLLQKIITDHHNSETIRNIYEKHKYELESLYKFCVEQHHFEIRELGWGKEVYKKEMILMLKDFDIVPTFITTKKVEQIFEKLLKNKPKVDKNMLQFGLAYEDFLHALLRITIKCQKKLKMFYTKFQ